MAKLVLRLGPLAKAALTTSLVGCAIAVYGREKGVAWAALTGSLLFFAGAVVYLVERLRSLGRRRS